MTKDQVLAEIRRTAAERGGAVPGSARFESITGITRSDWFGVYWARWGDAVREAGLQPNQLQRPHKLDELLRKYAELANELGRLPVKGDLGLKRRSDPGFPSWNTFDRLGKKADIVQKLTEFCEIYAGFKGVAEMCQRYREPTPKEEVISSVRHETGYVYLVQHGSRRQYKIGRTNNMLRREGEIGLELPEAVEPIHVIETDDPAGIEAYWHRRFAEKRLKNEWFALNADDVRAFKRWRRIC